MVVDCGTSRRSWLPRPTVVVVARTESLSVSALARTVVGASTVPRGADAAGDGADAADAAGGAVCANAAGWNNPKPAASAPSERTLGVPGKRVSAAAGARRNEAEGSNGRVNTCIPLGWARAGDGGLVRKAEGSYLVRINLPSAVCLSR